MQKQDVIDAITRLGHTVMVLKDPILGETIILVNNWVPTSANSIESRDFLTVNGVNVTTFINSLTNTFNDKLANLAQALTSGIAEGVVVARQYHKDVQWMIALPSR